MKKSKLLVFNDIRHARAQLGLTQLDLAEHLGIARTSISNAEKDEPKPWMYLAVVGLGSLLLMSADVKQLNGKGFSTLRQRLQLTPAALGSKLGMAESTIITWERHGPPLWAYPALIALSAVQLME